MANLNTEETMMQALVEIMNDNGFSGSSDGAKFEKKDAEKSMVIKAQQSVTGDISIRVKTANKVTNKKTETIFHHLSTTEAIQAITKSLFI